MEEDSYNPLSLSLEEVIRLQRLRNREAEQTSSVPVKNDTNNVHSNGIADDANFMLAIEENRRRNRNENVTENENRSIHDRLGWNKTRKQQALRAVRNAQQFKHRKNVTRKVKNFAAMPPPLTSKVLKRHDQKMGNFMVRRTGPGSTASASTCQTARPIFYRHSLKKCLDPEIHKQIKTLIDDPRPVEVFTNQGEAVRIDLPAMLRNYTVNVDTTPLPSYIRFALND